MTVLIVFKNKLRPEPAEPASQPSPAQPAHPAQPARARHPKIAVLGFNSFHKRAILLLRNGVPGRRRNRHKLRFRVAFRIPLWSVSLQGTRISRVQKCSARRPFWLAFQIPFWSVSLQGTRIYVIQKMLQFWTNFVMAARAPGRALRRSIHWSLPAAMQLPLELRKLPLS